MAFLKFLKGNYSSLNNAAISEGQVLICGDTGEMFVDIAADKRVKIGDYITVSNIAALEALDATAVPTSRLYYVEDGNILARSNGTTWVQINKQPDIATLKVQLGLGSLAYLSEVSESNLSAELAEKVNASAEGNHAHANKEVLDGITAEKVAAWDAAEGNAKTYADGLNTAMNTRVEALEAVDHTHTNKALLDTYTQTEENLADAVAKKHEHANKAELDKIVAGDVTKWNGVVADHLVAADKAALEDAIGDVNTALGEEVTRAKAAEKANADAITAIKNGAAVNDFAGVEAELAKKVDKVTGKSLVDDAEITKLAGVSAGANKVEASETNGNIKIDGVETVVYTHPAKHAIADVDGLQAALDGMQTKGDYAAEDHTHTKDEITDFAHTHEMGEVNGLADALAGLQVKGDYAAEEHTHVASEITDLDATIKAYDYATKEEAQVMADGKDAAIEAAQAAADKAQGEVDALETYVGTFTASEGVDTVVKYIDAKTANIASDETVSALADRVKAIEDDYLVEADKTALSDAIAAEKERAEGIEGGLETRLAAVEADYLKAADKTELSDAIAAEKTRAEAAEAGLQTQINTIMNNPDAEGAINSINEFTQYVKDHGTIAEGFRTDIDKNKEDIAAEVKRASDAESALSGRIDTLEAIDHDAYVAADITLKNELTAEIAKKADASALTSAVETLEAADTALSGRVEKLENNDAGYATTGEVATAKEEAIAAAKTDAANQDAVVLAEAQAYADQAEADAIAAAKTETENQVKALAEGAVADNTADIATIMEMLTWGSFGE